MRQEYTPYHPFHITRLIPCPMPLQQHTALTAPKNCHTNSADVHHHQRGARPGQAHFALVPDKGRSGAALVPPGTTPCPRPSPPRSLLSLKVPRDFKGKTAARRNGNSRQGRRPTDAAVCLTRRVWSVLVRRVVVRWQPQLQGSAPIRARLTQAASSARALLAAARPFRAQQPAPRGQANKQSPSGRTPCPSKRAGGSIFFRRRGPVSASS